MNKIEFTQRFVLKDAAVFTVYGTKNEIFRERVQERIEQACKIYNMIEEHFEPEDED